MCMPISLFNQCRYMPGPTYSAMHLIIPALREEWDTGVDAMDGMDEDDATRAGALVWFFLSLASLSVYLVQCMTPKLRNPPLFVQRLNWENFMHVHGHRRDFKRHMRMSKASFDKVLSYIVHDLESNQQMAALRGGAIIPEIQLYCCIRWLAGGMYSDIYLFTGISCPSFYRVVWRTIHAINRCPQLHIHFPQTREECSEAAAGFRSVSFHNCINNVVSVVDGYLLHIITPRKEEAKNVRSYFSGHYQKYGVNIQAACDHLCRFTFIGMAGPGVMGDRDAIKQVPLYDLIENLPELFATIGDCAYKATEHMVPIFSGSHRSDSKCDAFNFYASQLRIRIEMAFGMMTKKWGILNRPVSTKLSNVKFLILAIAQLHNFCINERILETGILQPRRNEWETTIYEQSKRAEAAEIESLASGLDGWSFNRDRMAADIKKHGLRRPTNSRGRGLINGCVAGNGTDAGDNNGATHTVVPV